LILWFALNLARLQKSNVGSCIIFFFFKQTNIKQKGEGENIYFYLKMFKVSTFLYITLIMNYFPVILTANTYYNNNNILAAYSSILFNLWHGFNHRIRILYFSILHCLKILYCYYYYYFDNIDWMKKNIRINSKMKSQPYFVKFVRKCLVWRKSFTIPCSGSPARIL